jgi:hydroxymethylbilane synthase
MPIRGNLDTRIRKLVSEKLEGIVVAAAGLIRMGWKDKIVEFIDPGICLPAPGQGALAIEIREDSWEELSFLHSLNDLDTYLAVMAERAFLRGLGGGCQLPIGALGEIRGPELHLIGVVLSPEGKIFRRKVITDKKERAERLGLTLAEEILDREIAEILEKISAI